MLRGTTTAFPGQGAAQLTGYRVCPVVNVIERALFAGMLLCSAALTVMPYGSGYDPASFRFFRNGISSAVSSQNRRSFGSSGAVQFTFNSRSNEMPPKI